ncbi:PepSY-associated TM helix domain-containing protein [Sphingomonas naphthae]|uniref:PepSY-associated TM helix domain-containing protein n=1 Tax=Sphingomonas naphthae TaxID=1813468 RepID=A0ABY7TEZ3_9SPHN|nr:PepSY-associated TM helix domain-containing protein [Sphingomonas naphthae]WCT71837.1 PepSY-associated TM helix domain-containing protein [Sphingomonas naphthae]
MASQRRRGFWLKHLHRWHWISSGLCLVGMILFAVTGITLNHAGSIASEPKTITRVTTLPPPVRRAIAGEDEAKRPLPPAVRDAIAGAIQVDVPADTIAEWSADEVFLDMPRPGSDATLSIDRIEGRVEYERTDRGWISFLNDLHKGRNAGAAWSWFLDIFAASAIIFAFTGLFLLQLHGRQRPATWPVVGLGLIAPLILILLFIH